MSSCSWLTTCTTVLLLVLLCLGQRQYAVAVGRHGDGSVSQADVIRFVLSMQSKEGPTAMDRARLRHYQQLPSIKFADRHPNDVNVDDDDKTLIYGL